jgi:polyisoprenoid-binding protein YceI
MMRYRLALSTLLLVSAALTAAAVTLEVKSGEVRYEVEIKTLWIGGSTIVGKNTKLIGKIETKDTGRVEGGVIVPVARFESNNTRRDKDVAKILNYKEYPAITIEVIEVTKEDVDKILSEHEGEVHMKVRISAAGGSKTYDTVIRYQHTGDDEVRCSTSIDAKFTDFGIKPPTFGLILKSAPDAIKLSADIVYRIQK